MLPVSIVEFAMGGTLRDICLGPPYGYKSNCKLLILINYTDVLEASLCSHGGQSQERYSLFLLFLVQSFSFY